MGDRYHINPQKLEEVFVSVSKALKREEGIFNRGIRRFLPQWDLPKELEYNPQKIEVKDPLLASKLLFARTSVDKMQDSGFLHQCLMRTWYDLSKRWIFEPKEVYNRTPLQIEQALQDFFHYNLRINKEVSAGQAYHRNAGLVEKYYDGDPRNLIKYKTVAQARECIMKLVGFGTGLTNLFMVECASRNIANAFDPENLRPKIDRHKARIPLNTDVIELGSSLLKTGRIHASEIVKPLERAYVEAAQRKGLNLIEIDAALWVIGSEICSKSDLNLCSSGCPLYKSGLCKSNTVLDPQTGYFIMFEGNSRYDSRRNHGQNHFNF